MSLASSWNTVDVVRPHPGQAATIGTNDLSPMVCRISCATRTSCASRQKEFTATVYLSGVEYGRGTGRSKKEAEQGAARQAYQRLRDSAGIAEGM